MKEFALLPRLLGSLLYYYPSTKNNNIILKEIEEIKAIFPWNEVDKINYLVDELILIKNNIDDYEYSVLFEGQGKMLAPPWGSVYQNKDNLVMDVSTERFNLFLQDNNISFQNNTHPSDHIAIMLWTLAILIEDNKVDQYTQLMSEHLLTWVYRYLELLSNNDISEFYATLAKICNLMLKQLEIDMNINPKKIKLYL